MHEQWECPEGGCDYCCPVDKDEVSDVKAFVFVMLLVGLLTATMIWSGVTQLRYSCEFDDEWMSSSGECVNPDTFLDAAKEAVDG